MVVTTDSQPRALAPTSCVDPHLHFNVRELRGTVVDENGKGLPHVKGDLFCLRKIKAPNPEGQYEPLPNVFSTFETDEHGVFRSPHLRPGLYRVVLHPPRLYLAMSVVVKVDRNTAPAGLVARMGLTGTCGARWDLEDTNTH